MGRGLKLGPGKLVSIWTGCRHEGGVLCGGWDGGVKNAVVSQLGTVVTHYFKQVARTTMGLSWR